MYKDENLHLKLTYLIDSTTLGIMKSILHIFSAILITFAAVIPSGLVVCEKNGQVSLEFKSGEACSCDEQSIDMEDKFCCEDIECHEDENVTEQCHDENQFSANDCSDTKIEALDALKYFSNSLKVPVKTFKTSEFFAYSDFLNTVVYGLNTPIDVGKTFTLIEIPRQALTIKKTTVFLI